MNTELAAALPPLPADLNWRVKPTHISDCFYLCLVERKSFYGLFFYKKTVDAEFITKYGGLVENFVKAAKTILARREQEKMHGEIVGEY